MQNHPPLKPAGKRWRIGVVGAGNIAGFHLQAWANCPDAVAVAICDTDRARARERADAFAIETVYPDIEAMISAGGIDALDVLTSRGTHEAMVRRAADAGLPVLCQKPLTDYLATSEALVSDVHERTRLMVNENSRFRPHYRQLGEWISRGRLGEIRQVRDSLLTSGFLPQTEGEPAQDLARQRFLTTVPRALIAEVLVHQIDVLRSLLGPLALLNARTKRTSTGIVGEDVATLMLETEARAPVIVEGNRAAPGFTPGWAEDLLVIGTEATARVTDYDLALLGPDPEHHAFDRGEAVQAGFDHAARAFIACLETGAPFPTADNLETLRLVEEAYEKAGKPPRPIT